MKQKPAVRSDSFWGDLANALALKPIYRKPLHQTQPQQVPPATEPDLISRAQEKAPAEQAPGTAAASSQHETQSVQASSVGSASRPITAEQKVDDADITATLQSLYSQWQADQISAIVSASPAPTAAMVQGGMTEAFRHYIESLLPVISQQSPASPKPEEKTSTTQREIDHNMADVLASTEWAEQLPAPERRVTSTKKSRRSNYSGTSASTKDAKPLTEKQLERIGLSGTSLIITAGLFQGKSFRQITKEVGKPRLELLREWNQLLDEYQVFSEAKLLNALRAKHASLVKKRKRLYARQTPLRKKIARSYRKAVGGGSNTRSGSVTIVHVPVTDAGKRVVIPRSQGEDYLLTTSDHHGSVVSELIHAGGTAEGGEESEGRQTAGGHKEEE